MSSASLLLHYTLHLSFDYFEVLTPSHFIPLPHLTLHLHPTRGTCHRKVRVHPALQYIVYKDCFPFLVFPTHISHTPRVSFHPPLWVVEKLSISRKASSGLGQASNTNAPWARVSSQQWSNHRWGVDKTGRGACLCAFKEYEHTGHFNAFHLNLARNAILASHISCMNHFAIGNALVDSIWRCKIVWVSICFARF